MVRLPRGNSPIYGRLFLNSEDKTVKIRDFSRPRRYRECERRIEQAEAALSSSPDDPAALATLGEWKRNVSKRLSLRDRRRSKTAS
jgi:hypothetical protein